MLLLSWKDKMKEQYKSIRTKQDIDKLQVGDIVNCIEYGRISYSGRHPINNKYIFVYKQDQVIIELRPRRDELHVGQNGFLDVNVLSDFSIFSIDDITHELNNDLLKKEGL